MWLSSCINNDPSDIKPKEIETAIEDLQNYTGLKKKGRLNLKRIQ